MNIEIIDKKLAHCIKIIPNSDVKISLHVSWHSWSNVLEGYCEGRQAALPSALCGSVS